MVLVIEVAVPPVLLGCELYGLFKEITSDPWGSGHQIPSLVVYLSSYHFQSQT